MKSKIKGDKTDLSLDNLYPMPKELSEVLSPPTIVSEKDYKSEVEKTKKENKTIKFFDMGLPITKKMSTELKKKYGANNWYDWSIKNWGTKWDVESTLEDDDNDRLEYLFDTAWSPPINWLKKVSKDFPKLSFFMKYEEEGMGFIGKVSAKNGKVDDNWID